MIVQTQIKRDTVFSKKKSAVSFLHGYLLLDHKEMS